jgi:nucleoside-diphosphate-sugar epimerase
MLTGARGFTGRHFAEHARAAGHDVISLKSNLKDTASLDQEVQEVGPEAVVHLAAISFVGHAFPNGFYDVNVIGTLNLLEALTKLARRPQSVLLSSSANVYGNCTTSPISEQQQAAPVNHYATSKLAMEFMARTYSSRLPLFFTRPFNYTGPGQPESFIIPKLVKHFVDRKVDVELGNINVEREFNDVRFVCDAYLRLLLKAPANEVINICSGQPVTLESVITLLSRITKHDIKIEINPAFVRANEIHRLCGDPTKLINLIGTIPMPSFTDTLKWMLAKAPANRS